MQLMSRRSLSTRIFLLNVFHPVDRRGIVPRIDDANPSWVLLPNIAWKCNSI